MKINEKEYYDKVNNWSFSEFDIVSEKYTDWNMYEILNKVTNKNSKILNLGTGGGEKLLKYFPETMEILGTDYSEEMIKTANNNLLLSKRKNITFKVMDNLNMNVTDNYYDVVVARNTKTDPKQIYKCLKRNGILIIHGVDKYDCYELKMIFGKGQGENDKKPISIIDFQNVFNANFRDITLVPLHVIEYFKDKDSFYNFLLKVPIIDDFDDDFKQTKLDSFKLDLYIKRNTTSKEIRLVRKYYGITARK